LVATAKPVAAAPAAAGDGVPDAVLGVVAALVVASAVGEPAAFGVIDVDGVKALVAAAEGVAAVVTIADGVVAGVVATDGVAAVVVTAEGVAAVEGVVAVVTAGDGDATVVVTGDAPADVVATALGAPPIGVPVVLVPGAQAAESSAPAAANDQSRDLRIPFLLGNMGVFLVGVGRPRRSGCARSSVLCGSEWFNSFARENDVFGALAPVRFPAILSPGNLAGDSKMANRGSWEMGASPSRS
jgi:hypothetical protein